MFNFKLFNYKKKKNKNKNKVYSWKFSKKIDDTKKNNQKRKVIKLERKITIKNIF